MLENNTIDACDFMALARKVNWILELNTTNLIPKRSLKSLLCTFPFNVFFSCKETQRGTIIQWLNVYKVREECHLTILFVLIVNPFYLIVYNKPKC